MAASVLRLFVSSPGDVADERRRVELVAERLNTEFADRVRIETVRWELGYYSAHETFQRQIPEAADCDVVVAVFRGRLGTPLPSGFPPLPSGEPYPSGTAYEVLSAIHARRARAGLPDVYVFRYPNAPSVELDAPDRAEIETQWQRLKAFFDTWFQSRSGEFIAAFQNYSSTDDFARKVEECLRQWLGRRGFRSQGTVWDRVLHGSPFPGLAAFEAKRGRVFFGRDLATSQALERLREAGAGGRRVPFLLVIGASGSGKSSLLRAGLLPRLVLPGSIPEIDLWRAAMFTPGADPFLSLAESLFNDAALGHELREGAFRTKELLAKQLAGDPDTAAAPLQDALERVAERRRAEAAFDAPRPVRLALAMDQAERLFTEAEARTTAAMGALLAALVRRGLAYVVMVLRSDAYARFQGVEALVGLREDGATFDLLPPSTAELEEIVTRPVAACDPPLAFERNDGRSLAALLVADAQGGDALPMLQTTLSRLYAAEAARGDGVLRFADYRGMDSAVTETANEVLESVGDAARAALPALVSGLVVDVVADPLTGAPVPVVAALDRHSFELQAPARTALVEAFVAKRLLTVEGDSVSQRVRPVHEALLRIWPQAVAIVGETASLIRIRHTLEPLVRGWSAATAGEQAAHLELSPALLNGAQQALARFGADLPPAMGDFIAQATAMDAARRGRERAEQERRIRDAEAVAAADRRTARRTLAGLAVTVVLAALAGWQWHEAGTQRDRAQRSLALATETANGLVFDLARKFTDVVGIPATTIKDILDRASQLQEQLLGSSESSPALRRSQAAASSATSDILLKLGDTPGALAAATKARSILQTLLATEPENKGWQRDLSVAEENVGDVQRAQGNLPAALASYQAALTIAGRLAEADPGSGSLQGDVTPAQNKVGDVQRAMGNLPAALVSYQAALTITGRLAEADPGNAGLQRDLGVSYGRIGAVQQAQGSLPAAMASYQAEFAISEQLAKASPANAVLQRDLTVSEVEIGDVLEAQGNLPAALASYGASLAITERLAKADPANASQQSDCSATLEKVGNVQLAQRNFPAALASYQAALAIDDRLAKADPGNTEWQRDLSVTQNEVGNVQNAQGDLPAALASYQASLAIRDRLAKADPGNAEWQRDLAVSHDEIGDVQQAQSDFPAALASYQAALAIGERLAKGDPGNAGWQRDLALDCGRVAMAELVMDARDDALAEFRRGRDIIARLALQSPDNVRLPFDLAWFDGFIAETEK